MRSTSSSPPIEPVRVGEPQAAPDQRQRWWNCAAGIGVIAVCLALWIPRLSGPLDLRFDAGVYYLLGTSISTGEGYRILNEPGAPTGIQYPPALPLLVAVHQWILGTTEPDAVATAMRLTYAVMFFAYALAILALARRWLPTWAAFVATTLCLLSVHTYFLSDLLFAEIPFGLISVGFVLLATHPVPPRVPWRRDVLLFLLAAVAFFLRTAGLALFAAWALDALLRRRWRAALVRIGLTLVPFGLWQGHIMRVQSSDEFAQPAYEYQRAPYQFYNVSYGTNVMLVDPFQPELGRVGLGELVQRVGGNVLLMPQATVEAATLQRGYWRRPISRIQQRLFGDGYLIGPLSWLPVICSMILLPIGIGVLIWRRAWLLVGLIVASVGLVCLTPWPGQFQRYLSPLVPFLSLALVIGSLATGQWLARRGPLPRRLGWAALGLLLATTIAAQTWMARRLFQVRAEEGVSYVSREQPQGQPFFFHDEQWRYWEQAAEWVGENTPADAVIATSSPHLLYLRTGRLTVMPPMVDDPAEARRLLEAVPVTYVIVDGMEFIDISRRYALPAVESAPEQWQVVAEFDDTRIFGRPTGGGQAGSVRLDTP